MVKDEIKKIEAVVLYILSQARKYGPVPMLSDKVIKTVETRETLRGQADLKAFAGSIRVDEGQLVFGTHEPEGREEKTITTKQDIQQCSQHKCIT